MSCVDIACEQVARLSVDVLDKGAYLSPPKKPSLRTARCTSPYRKDTSNSHLPYHTHLTGRVFADMNLVQQVITVVR